MLGATFGMMINDTKKKGDFIGLRSVLNMQLSGSRRDSNF
jgi:hypothetical protein